MRRIVVCCSRGQRLAVQERITKLLGRFGWREENVTSWSLVVIEQGVSAVLCSFCRGKAVFFGAPKRQEISREVKRSGQ